MDANRDRELDAALTRMRAAFADKSEEQIMDDVIEIIDQMREARRKEITVLRSA